jgi:hypothetical protein
MLRLDDDFASFETPAAPAPQDDDFLNAINNTRHAEERPGPNRAASRSTPDADAALGYCRVYFTTRRARGSQLPGCTT